MYPELLSIPTPEFLKSILPDPLIVQSYGFVIMLGVLCVYFFMKPRVKVFGLSPDDLSNLIFVAFIAAFIGGKIFYYLQEPAKYLADPKLMFADMGSGFVFYGSLLFAVPTIVYLLRKKKVPIKRFLDLLAFVGPIIHSFGRIGCFLAGCCYGQPCDNILGVVFSHPLTKARPRDTMLYPTQLFDIAVNLLILLVVYAISKKKQFDGQLFLIYIALYGVGRSIVEIYRGDGERGFFFDLISHSQMIALVLIIVCVYLWKKWSKNERAVPSSRDKYK